MSRIVEDGGRERGRNRWREGEREREVERQREREGEKERERRVGVNPVPQLSGLQIWVTDCVTLRQEVLQRHLLDVKGGVAEGST